MVPVSGRAWWVLARQVAFMLDSAPEVGGAWPMTRQLSTATTTATARLTCAADTAVVQLKDLLLCLHDESIIDAHLHNTGRSGWQGGCSCCSANELAKAAHSAADTKTPSPKQCRVQASHMLPPSGVLCHSKFAPLQTRSQLQQSSCHGCLQQPHGWHPPG